MNTSVVVNTYVHSVTYVTDKMLMSLKEIIRCSGLSPGRLANDWTVLERGISAWLGSKHLEMVTLEVFDPSSGALVGRWDFDISYDGFGDGAMWTDTDDIRYHIVKAGRWPSACDYCILVTTKPGCPAVEGWSSTTFCSTDGFIRQSLGTTIGSDGLLASAAYWRLR